MGMNLVIEHFVLIDLEILHQHLVMIHKELIFLAETLDQHFFELIFPLIVVQCCKPSAKSP